MASNNTRRGFDPKDERFFSNESIINLGIAQEEIQWLLDRNYKIGTVINFVGDHYLLSSRQRLALKRATATKMQYKKRKSKLLPLKKAKHGCMFIDGFNIIITLEVALSGSILILGKDGVLRDLAGLRGTYRLIDKTERALSLIGMALNKFNVPQVKFFLDEPVSNSGRLRNRILEHSKTWNIPTEVELVRNPDPILSDMERVVTGDSIILDNCSSWFNLSRKIVEDYIEDAWVVRFDKKTDDRKGS
ncbi:MAG: DUF434 domain-containing protein [Candidatus Alkaliphilus sp. MAG34]|nr:DUF434 domain-containing protein [Bacillota bacterium]NMA03613.1 DUF434 domain-containing protein [Clostridiales bacterium]